MLPSRCPRLSLQGIAILWQESDGSGSIVISPARNLEETGFLPEMRKKFAL